MIRVQMNHLAALRYLALPFHAAPLLLVAIFSVLLLFGVQGGLLGLPIVAILGSWFFKYAFMLLDHAANGRPGTPVLSPEAINPLGEMRPLAYAFAIAVFYLASGALEDYLGPQLVSAIRLLALAALPAMIATSVITGSFVQALHPGAVAEVTRRLGVGYLLILCVAIACGWVGNAIVLDAGHLALLLRIALLMLLWLALFCVLGGVIHERRFELGFEPEHSPERRQQREDKERDRERDRFIDQVFAEYRAGARGNPWATIQQRATQSARPVAEYEWIYERVAAWANPKLANRVAQELLPLLLASQRNGEALRIVKGRLTADAEFRPLTSEQLIRLAQLARDGGDRPLARQLLHDFERRFPDDASRTSAQRLAKQLGSL